jgi:Cu-processing system permease protein
VLLLLQFDLGALAGYTGAVFERFFGAFQGSAFSATALMLWIAVPFAGGLRLFTRKDF